MAKMTKMLKRSVQVLGLVCAATSAAHADALTPSEKSVRLLGAAGAAAQVCHFTPDGDVNRP